MPAGWPLPRAKQLRSILLGQSQPLSAAEVCEVPEADFQFSAATFHRTYPSMSRTSSQRMRSSILFSVPFQGSDSEYEVDPGHQKGISRAQAYSYTESDSGEPEHTPLSHSTSTQQGSLFRPKASRTPTPQTPGNAPSSQPGTLYCPPSSLAPGSRAPIAGFSSFV
ncbi:protein sidekick-2-like isoform X1 [Catharus ustulatus]|uniref:protein sidekick-2-like isoform X1 n=1 Tax=Catharus ustulatus TaxID=91951 RepID=UPI001408E864|nr:protein sidekick-2-like isoform X1 [Catharus ustulatus]